MLWPLPEVSSWPTVSPQTPEQIWTDVVLFYSGPMCQLCVGLRLTSASPWSWGAPWRPPLQSELAGASWVRPPGTCGLWCWAVILDALVPAAHPSPQRDQDRASQSLRLPVHFCPSPRSLVSIHPTGNSKGVFRPQEGAGSGPNHHSLCPRWQTEWRVTWLRRWHCSRVCISWKLRNPACWRECRRQRGLTAPLGGDSLP